VNWLTYVYAIATDRALDAALGYYINPLFSVFLGFALLGEKLTQRQWIAIFLTLLAVAILTYEVGSLPWLSLILTISWGFYALFKRSLPIGPNQGFLLEVLLLCPLAILYLSYLSAMGENHFVSINVSTTLLLVGCGVVTAVPLIVYANGAKLLKLSTIAMLQYIAPTLIFLVAVFVFGEEFGWAKKVAFPLIWVALIIFTSSSAKAR
jgi:chloramphenicol-sensitive protein RarD